MLYFLGGTLNIVVILRGNKRYVLTISSSDMCLHYSLIIYTLSVELFVCQSSKRGKLLDYMLKQSLFIVVLMVSKQAQLKLMSFTLCSMSFTLLGT